MIPNYENSLSDAFVDSAFTYEKRMAEPEDPEDAATEGPHAQGKGSAADSVAQSNTAVNRHSM